jgi:hypothetical protein
MRPSPEVAYLQNGNRKIVFHTLLFPILGEVSIMPEFTTTLNGYRIEFQRNKWEIIAPEDGEWQLVGNTRD